MFPSVKAGRDKMQKGFTLVEVLCDECDGTVDVSGLDDASRRELMSTIGAR